MSAWKHADGKVVFVSDTKELPPPYIVAAILAYGQACSDESDMTRAFQTCVDSISSWHAAEIMELAGWLAQAEQFRIMRHRADHADWSFFDVRQRPSQYEGSTISVRAAPSDSKEKADG
jgi:hypothetical protein